MRLLGALLLLAATARADVQLCPLYTDVPVPQRNIRACRRLQAQCTRLCRRYPGMVVCAACHAPGGPCARPLPTLTECCAAGYEVQGLCAAMCAEVCQP